MISRAASALAAALLLAPFGASAAPLQREPASAAYASHRPHHFHMVQRHHRPWAHAHRGVVYRSPAYAARGWHRPHHRHGHHAWHGRSAWHPGPVWRRRAVVRVAYPAPVRVVHRVSYAYPVAGSYLGGPLSGAMYNQPLCPCW